MGIKSVLLLSAFASLCIFSCKSRGGRHHSATDKKYHLSLHLPPGSKYYYTITNQMQTVAEANGKSVNNNNQSEIGLIYEVLNNAADTILLKVTYDKLNFNLKSNNQEQQMDASNSIHTLDPVEKLLGTIRGKSIQITLTEKGDIVNVSGTKEITDTILKAVNAQDAYIKNTLRDQMAKLVGDEFIRNNLQYQFRFFPDTAIYIGDSWSKAASPTSEIKTDAVTKYTLADVNGNTAEVAAASEMSGSSTTTLMGSEVQANLEGTQKGTYEADITTGLLMKGKSTTSMEGIIQLMGREVPVKIVISKQMATKKL